MRRLLLLGVLMVVAGFGSAQTVRFDGNWGQYPLLNIQSSTRAGLDLVFSMHEMVIEEQDIDGVPMRAYGVPAVFIAEPGVPNLGGVSRWVALPQGAEARVTILDYRKEEYDGIEIAPAPNLPADNDDSPLKYVKNASIFSKDAYWPSSPVVLGQKTDLRGVDVMLLSVLPFQYNPVTKHLIVYQDIRFRIDFVGGNGHFGVDRLRSRFWDPVLQGNLINYDQLPVIDYYAPERIGGRAGFEYIIIVPDDATFIAWADTLKRWRKLQGISTEVYTTTQCGGNDSAHIKSFLTNAYNTWSPAPVAFLILSDFNPSGDVYGVPATRLILLGETVASDNWYADMNANNLPDLDHGRICAQTGAQLDTIIHKMLAVERNPSTAAAFYSNTTVAAAWQTERWFQLAGEVVRQFNINGLGKNPSRLYAVYSGTPTPGCAWSSRQGTAWCVNYWHNLGWLPSTTNPGDVAWWSTGNATAITNSINSGSWFVQHRDHGGETLWGEPAYSNADVLNLTNANSQYPYINSSNCLTGKYIYSGECMTERFHRDTHCAVGINAASEVSYSFVNDGYIWGIWDGLFPQFDPGYPNFALVGHHNLRPCQAMTHGKIYLATTAFADSAGLGTGGYREITYHLFHHHGDCFMTPFSVVPMTLTVSHAAVLTAGVTSFTVTANDSSVIALTVNGEIIGTAMGTGGPVAITIPAQTPGSTMKVTVTRFNYRRYAADVPVVASSYPYVGIQRTIINDYGNGQVNPGDSILYSVWAKNMGNGTAQSVWGRLSDTTVYTTITRDSSWYGNILQNDSALSNPPYKFRVASNAPNGKIINFTLRFEDVNDSIFTSYTNVTVYAPVLIYQSVSVTGGNGNGILDPGETANLVVTIKNDGGADAQSVTSTLMESSPYLTIGDASGNYGTVTVGSTANNSGDPYTVTAAAGTPIGTSVPLQIRVVSGVYCDTLDFSITIGRNMPTDTGYYYTYWSHGPYQQAPVYSWYAIDSTQTLHPGTPLNMTDDVTSPVSIPFTFRYYGVAYTAIAVCSNGWVALGTETSTNYTNTGLPNASAPAKAVFGIWDDLNPGATGPGEVYHYNDATNHRYVVEWFRVEHYGGGSSTAENFEILLYDPAYYPTPTNDGEIVIQYRNTMKQTDNTVGIQNAARTVGIQYYLEGTYHTLGVPITDTFALKFTPIRPTVGVAEEGGLSAILGARQLLVYPTVGRGRVQIAYSVGSQAERVGLKVYDISGRLVRDLSSFMSLPSSLVTWDGSDANGRAVSAGVYFVKLTAGDKEVVQKAVLLR